MRARQAEQRPRSARKLNTGTFSYHGSICPQAGQRERGISRLKGSGAASAGTAGACAAGCGAARGADSAAPCRSLIFRRREKTTLQKAAEKQTDHAAQCRVQPQARKHYTTCPNLKIGRYIEMTMPPIRQPRKTMMIGSIRLDMPATMVSTSAS